MLRKYREAQNEEGFTLIELLVVVLIIGILAAIAIPVFLDQRQKAYANAVESDVRNLALIAEDTASDNNGSYDMSGVPFEVSDGVTLTFNYSDVSSDGFCIQGAHAALTASYAYDAGIGATNARVTEGGTCAAWVTASTGTAATVSYS